MWITNRRTNYLKNLRKLTGVKKSLFTAILKTNFNGLKCGFEVFLEKFGSEKTGRKCTKKIRRKRAFPTRDRSLM